MCFFIVSKKSPARFWGLVSQNQNKKKKDEGRFIYKNEYNNTNLSTILLLSY